jgi:H+/gluconate symporter-like permease
MGNVIKKEMGSFLALVGMIIMMGSGLGTVMRKAGVSANIVYTVMRKFGVNTQKRAILATMFCCVILVALLGTLAGSNAIIAPIAISVVAALGIKPSTMAVVILGAGHTGLFLGPFTPPVVTMMELTGMPYHMVMLTAGLPMAAVIWVSTFIMANKNQKKAVAAGEAGYEGEVSDLDNYQATPEVRRSTWAFVISMIGLAVFGIIIRGGASFAIIVMITASIIVGFVSKMKLGEIFESFCEGCGKFFWIFFMMVLFDPFLNFIIASGGFDALVEFVSPFIMGLGRTGAIFATTVISIFGIQGAAVAQAMIMHELFFPVMQGMGISMQMWCVMLLMGHQMTTYAYPGIDMFAQSGLARSPSIKPLIHLGYKACIPGCLAMTMLLSIFYR